MRDRAHSIYSTFAIRVALLYLFFESWCCWIFKTISLSKLYNLIWITGEYLIIVIWRNIWAPNLWRIKRMASHNYIKWQKSKYNNIKLVKIWLKYKLDPGFWKPLATSSAWNSGMFGDVTPTPYPQYFLIGFRRFTKMTLERSRETILLQSPVAPLLRVRAGYRPNFEKCFGPKILSFLINGYLFPVSCS